MFELITPLSYWVLSILWLLILVLYLSKLRQLRISGSTVALLLTLLAIDAFRTLFESTYFGFYFNSLYGLLPKSIHAVLSKPSLVIIPKLINILAGLLVLFLLLRRWIPREIKEREEWLDKLQGSEANFRNLAEGSVEGIAIFSKEQQLLFANQAFAEIFGYESPAEVLQKRITEFIAPHELAVQTGIIQAHFQGGYHPPHQKYQGQRRDGSFVWIQRTISTIAWQEETAMLAMHLDITESVKAEERIRLQEKQLIQADKMASLGILVSGVAHEINNPNNFITFNTPILANIWEDAIPILKKAHEESGEVNLGAYPFDKLDEVVPRLLSGISNGADRIKNIVGNLKAFANPESGDNFTKVDINSVLESATILLSNEIRNHTKYFSVEYGVELPPFLGNYQKIEQVMINLINNACQALSDTERAIRVKTEYDAKMQRIRLIVVDEGEGISPENLEKILDPFFTTKRGMGGTGLGLSVSFKIVEEHQGTLDFSSIEGKGTTAIMLLPAIV